MYKNKKKKWKDLESAVKELVSTREQPPREKLLNIYIANDQHSYIIYFISFYHQFGYDDYYDDKLKINQISIAKPDFLVHCWGKPHFSISGQQETYEKYGLTYSQAQEEFQKNLLFIENFNKKTLDKLN